MASFVIGDSLATRLFCFEELPAFMICPDSLRREDSIVWPAARTSSPPALKKEKVLNPSIC